MNSLLESKLHHGVENLSLELSQTQVDLLLEYLELMLKWNKVYNLTAVRDPAEIVTRHLLDSLALASWCEGTRFIDVGTGAGLPGVPLAILYPEKEFHLLDSNSKKTRFLFQVKTTLGLDNMAVHHSRVECFEPKALYDGVLSRAFASLLDMVEGCGHLLHDQGKFLAMKGIVSESEIVSVESLCDVSAVHALRVPGLDEQRHLVILLRKRCG